MFNFTSGTAELISYGSHAGSFGTVTGVPGGYTLDYMANQLDIVSTAPAGPATWQYANSGSWANPANWSGGTVPSGSGQTAVIGAATTASWTITLDNPQKVGTLIFANSASSTAGYTLSAGSAGSLTLDNSTSAAQITVTGGSHFIDSTVAVTLNSSLVISPTSGSTLEIDGNISENPSNSGKTLTLNDQGTLILAGSNSYTGGTVVTTGTLVLGSDEGIPDGTSLTVGDPSEFGGIQPAGGGLLSTTSPLSAPEAKRAPLAVSPVPEPGTRLIALAAALGLR